MDGFLNSFPNKLWFLHVCSTSLLKTLGEGKIVHNEQFDLLPQCFLPIWRNFAILSSLELSSALLVQSKNCRLGKG